MARIAGGLPQWMTIGDNDIKNVLPGLHELHQYEKVVSLLDAQ